MRGAATVALHMVEAQERAMKKLAFELAEATGIDYDDFVEHFNKWNGKGPLSAAQGLDFCKAKYSTTGRLPWQK